MSSELPRTGLMNPPETDALEQLRKIVEPPTPKTLNAQIEALSHKQREYLKLLVSQLNFPWHLAEFTTDMQITKI